MALSRKTKNILAILTALAAFAVPTLGAPYLYNRLHTPTLYSVKDPGRPLPPSEVRKLIPAPMPRIVELWNRYVRGEKKTAGSPVSKSNAEFKRELLDMLAAKKDLRHTDAAFRQTCEFLQGTNDVKGFDEVRAFFVGDEPEAQIARSAVDRYQLVTRIKKAIAEKNDAELQACGDELERFAADDRLGADIFPELNRYLDPAEEYSRELLFQYRKKIKDGFLKGNVKDRAAAPELADVGEPKLELRKIGGSYAWFDQNSLNVPEDLAFHFYVSKIAELNNMAAKLESDPSNESSKELLEATRKAIHEAKRRQASSIRIADWERRKAIEELCAELVNARDAGGLKALDEELAKKNYGAFCPFVKAHLSLVNFRTHGEDEQGPAVHEIVAWAIKETDQSLLVDGLKTFSQEEKIAVQLRGNLQNANEPWRRRLVWLMDSNGQNRAKEN